MKREEHHLWMTEQKIQPRFSPTWWLLKNLGTLEVLIDTFIHNFVGLVLDLDLSEEKRETPIPTELEKTPFNSVLIKEF